MKNVFTKKEQAPETVSPALPGPKSRIFDIMSSTSEWPSIQNEVRFHSVGNFVPGVEVVRLKRH
jgi:hypothetical protein